MSTKTIARTDNETIGDTRTIARTGTKETGMGGRPQVGSDAGDAATVMAGLSTEETVSTRTIAGADTETIEGETLPGDEKFNDIAGGGTGIMKPSLGWMMMETPHWGEEPGEIQCRWDVKNRRNLRDT